MLRRTQLLACIGEQFSEGEEICGVVVNMRQRQDKVCLWTKTASNEAVQVNVGKQFKEFLEYDQNCGFLAHVRLSRLFQRTRRAMCLPSSVPLLPPHSHASVC